MTQAVGLGAGIMGLVAGGVVSFVLALVMPPALRPIIRSRWNRARVRLLKGDVGRRLHAYEEAMAAFKHQEAEKEAEKEAARQKVLEAEARRRSLQRRREEEQRKYYEYWMSLKGEEFERQLATLFRTRGYQVRLTPTSGDQGVDLILWKDGKTTVVQCKGQKSPVGPAVVRELFGSMHAFRADRAILACTGGFTRGVKEFARSKPIDLIAANELASLARGEGGSVTLLSFKVKRS